MSFIGELIELEIMLSQTQHIISFIRRISLPFCLSFLCVCVYTYKYVCVHENRKWRRGLRKGKIRNKRDYKKDQKKSFVSCMLD